MLSTTSSHRCGCPETAGPLILPQPDYSRSPALSRAHSGDASGQAGIPPPEAGSSPGWPIVLYFHHVHPDLRHYTAVSPVAFDRALAQVGEQHAPLAPEGLPLVKEAGGHPEPACLLTFDDGYADVFHYALPIMERRGWRAVVFVSTEFVGKVQQHPVRGPLQHMTWEQLHELTRRGHIVGSHGSAHIPYSRFDLATAQLDIDNAQRVLQERLPGAPDWLAYPYGELPAGDLRFPSMCFGSIKAMARPWNTAPHQIRRTYLPADEPQRWEYCITEWRRAWAESL